MIKETTFPDREKQIERFEYIKDNVGNVIQNDIYIDGRLSAQFLYFHILQLIDFIQIKILPKTEQLRYLEFQTTSRRVQTYHLLNN